MEIHTFIQKHRIQPGETKKSIQKMYSNSLSIRYSPKFRVATITTEVHEVTDLMLSSTLKALKDALKSPKPKKKKKKSYKPMPIKDLKKLKVGDKYIVDWAKDDDFVNSYRCEFEEQTVKMINKDEVYYDGYSWYFNTADSMDGNSMDTGWGIARFVKVS